MGNHNRGLQPSSDPRGTSSAARACTEAGHEWRVLGRAGRAPLRNDKRNRVPSSRTSSRKVSCTCFEQTGGSGQWCGRSEGTGGRISGTRCKSSRSGKKEHSVFNWCRGTQLGMLCFAVCCYSCSQKFRQLCVSEYYNWVYAHERIHTVLQICSTAAKAKQSTGCVQPEL
jgi:hypothetical protein